MKETVLSMNAIAKAEKLSNSKFGRGYNRRKVAALLAFYGGISIGLGGLMTICAGYFLSAKSPEINNYGAAMIFTAFALVPAAIHALDRINNPAKQTGN